MNKSELLKQKRKVFFNRYTIKEIEKIERILEKDDKIEIRKQKQKTESRQEGMF